jgi:predicted RNA-binding protein with PUA-like domain
MSYLTLIANSPFFPVLKALKQEFFEIACENSDLIGCPQHTVLDSRYWDLEPSFYDGSCSCGFPYWDCIDVHVKIQFSKVIKELQNSFINY